MGRRRASGEAVVVVTPAVQAYLLELLADRREWFEAMRAALLANGVATDRLDHWHPEW